MKKVGDHVTIYEDPFTQSKPEGRAVLVSQDTSVGRMDDHGNLERWNVRFLGDPDYAIYPRWVL